MPITHATVATGTDSGTGEIHKAQWNADHVGGLSYVQSQLSADVSMTSTNTFYDGPAVTLSAGTWLLIGGALLLDGTGDGGVISWKLWDGTTVLANMQDSRWSGTAVWQQSQVLFGIVVIASGTPTWKISAASNAGTNSVIKAAGATNISGNFASMMTAVKIV